MDITNCTPLISIIIAVYNNVKYLPKAIESVVSQDFDNYEIIIVDDGSTDGSSELADSYENRYKQIRVIHQENQWIYASFNRGIKESKGEYIYILNSDDQLFPQSLSLLSSKILEYSKPDVIWTRIVSYHLNSNDEIIKTENDSSVSIKEKYYNSAEEVRDNWIYFDKSFLAGNQANLYRSEIAKKHPFRNDYYGADVFFNVSIAGDIKNCLVVSKPVYKFYIYQTKENASLDHYYEYEHRMFSELYCEFKKLFVSWNRWDCEHKKYFAGKRFKHITNEYKAINSVNCNLSVEQKIKKVIEDGNDDVLLECASLLGKREELESRILFEIREIIGDSIVDRDDNLKKYYELFDDFSKFNDEIVLDNKSVIDEKCLLYNDPKSDIIFYQQYRNYISNRKAGKKVLWLCNTIIPEFSGAYGIKPRPYGGWISGMLSEVDKNDRFEVALIFPVHNKNRMRDGCSGGHRFFSFHDNGIEGESAIEGYVERFREIISIYDPDIVHIWGTEYLHTYGMIKACESSGILQNTIISIQGLVSICSKLFSIGIDDVSLNKQVNGTAIIDQKKEFDFNGIWEKRSIEAARHVFGRTDWDKASSKMINSSIQYHSCGPILRELFYNTDKWDLYKIRRHSVFISQAGYPVKGFHLILDQLIFLSNRYDDLIVRIAGPKLDDTVSPYADYVMSQIKEKGLSRIICFTGQLDENEMIKEYKMANVFLSSSLIENESNSMCEAMITGTPVVASFVGGIPSVAQNGVSALLFPLNEPEIMAFQICSIFDDDALAQQLSEGGIKRAEYYNNRKRIITELSEGYNALLDG